MKFIFTIILSQFLLLSCINPGNILPDTLVNNALDPNNPEGGSGNVIVDPSALFVANIEGVDAIFELKSTSIVKHLVLPADSYLNSAVQIGQKIYYSLEATRFDTLGVSEVYELDIKTGVSKKISQFHQELTLGVSSITKAGNILYASARSNSDGFELHKYVNNHWQLVKDIESGVVGSFPTMFLEFKQNSYFLAYQAATGMELWSTKNDGSLHANLYAGKASSHVMPWFVKNDQIVVTAKNANTVAYDLYAVNEQGDVSKLLEPAAAANAGANPLNAYSYKDGVVASCHHDSTGRELCINSSMSGQWKILDINSGAKYSNPKFFTLYKGEIYFQAEADNGIELYKTDGDSFSLVNDLRPGSASSYPENLMVIGDKLYFSAYGIHGQGMYSYDGVNTTKITLAQKELKFARSLLHPSI